MPSVLAECPRPKADEFGIVRYEIRDRLRVEPAKIPGAGVVVWQPLISDSPYQRVLDLAVASPVEWRETREPVHGNRMLHAEIPPGAGTTLDVRYVVERLPVRHTIHPGCVRPLDDPRLFARDLAAEQFVDVDARTRALAAEIAGPESNPLMKARRFYDYVTSTMTYDAANQSWKGSTEHALVCAAGNCNDIHALFISLCRSAGIPARLVLGQALEPPPPGEAACDLCGYHCWAEFFMAGLGWLPADASCACKYGTHGLFGSLEMNHVAWSVGRDLVLAPAQRDAPVLFFAGPYAEAGGKAYRGFERHISFEVL